MKADVICGVEYELAGERRTDVCIGAGELDVLTRILKRLDVRVIIIQNLDWEIDMIAAAAHTEGLIKGWAEDAA